MLDKTKSVLRESSEITAQVMALECLVKKVIVVIIVVVVDDDG